MSKKNHENTSVVVTAESPATTEVVAEQPKVASEQPKEPKILKTKPAERQYRLIRDKAPSIPPKGKQRQIVLSILLNAEKPMTAHEISIPARTMGLTANAGVEASCGWHLHQMVKLGYVEVVNPTSSVETAAA